MNTQTANQPYGFKVDTFGLESQEAEMQALVSPLALRDLWTRHLLHEQLELEKVENLKYPLQHDFIARKFFDH